MASVSGVARDRIITAMEHALEDLASVQDPETGQFGYLFRGVGRPGVTGPAVYAYQLAGAGRTREAHLGVIALHTLVHAWSSAPEWPLHETYGITQALYHQGGVAWKHWRDQYVTEILKYQRDDGGWPAPGGEMEFGTAYATALCALLLQIPYRARPLNELLMEGIPLPAWRVTRNAATSYLYAAVPLDPTDIRLMDRRLPPEFDQADTFVIETLPRRMTHHWLDQVPALAEDDDDLSLMIRRLLIGGLTETALADEGSVIDYLRVFDQGRKPFLELLSPTIPLQWPEPWYATDSFPVLSANWSNHIYALRAAWAVGDAEQMGSTIRKMNSALTPQWRERHHRHLADTLEPLLDDGRTHFILLGGGRLFGPDGVLRLLEKRGFLVEQVR